MTLVALRVRLARLNRHPGGEWGTDRQRLPHTSSCSIFALEAVVNQELIIHEPLLEDLLRKSFEPFSCLGASNALERICQHLTSAIFPRNVNADALYRHRRE